MPTTRKKPTPAGPPILTSPERFLCRDLAWLEFNRRVLHMALDARTPLLERVRFLTIYSNNLDEFFMKRVGGIRHAVETGETQPAYEPLTPATLLHAVRQKVHELSRQQSSCWRDMVRPALRESGIRVMSWDELDAMERAQAEAWFRRTVFPILTPLAIDSGHRFPFISNMSVSLGLVLRRPGENEALFARVKVPDVPTRLYELEPGRRYVPVLDIIRHNLDDLFPGMEILQVMPFRVTRDAELETDQTDPEDLLQAVEQKLKKRRFAEVVRLEVVPGASPRILRFLMEELQLGPEDIYEVDGLIDYGMLNAVADLDLPQHKFSKWSPLPPAGLEDDEADIFARIRQGDLLLHHPYESFNDSVERFIEQASRDPKVLCIKQSLYRTSGDSPFIASLIRAAEAGKQVAVLVEVRARFDEARNIEWAKKLEQAGVHVAYGVIGLKTHTKTSLVVRQEGQSIRCYGHIGTGNYNSKTARLYEDLGILTCDPSITEDLVGLFNYMTGRSLQAQFNKLLVAPTTMKRSFLELIEREIAIQQKGGTGRIIAKMNQLEDRTVMDALYAAGRAGVQVDLVVRGFCCLRPGVDGLSPNVRVRSIIGRFLEHSRIFFFGGGHADPLKGDYFIGSADWMYRNLNTRVEAATPIELPAHRRHLWKILSYCLEDRRQSWMMRPDGVFDPVSHDGVDAGDPSMLGLHQRLMDDARAEFMRRHGGDERISP